MIEYLRDTPADDVLRGAISAAIANPASQRSVSASEAYLVEQEELRVLKERVEKQQAVVNALATAVRANALYEVHGGDL